ncbi:MAG: glycoside hydrolase family 16 protein [Sphingomonadales bacterium]|nr:glycoside hydrolase family 16 protein [Sphingomonadales bacterium]
MKFNILLFLLIAFCTHAQIKPALFQFKTDTVLQWHYHFGDEFSSQEVDQSKWYPRYPWGGLLLDQSQWAVPEMLTQKNGWLHLGAKEFNQKTQVPNWMINQEQAKELGLNIKNDSVYLDYLTSCIWSIDTFRYGYFECRAVIPQGKGLWPAFWLFGQNGKDEIDIMECKGERSNDVHVDIHLPERKDYVKNNIGIKKDWGGWIRMKNPVVNDTVIYSGVWLPNSLTYFVNGLPVSHFDGDFSTPMNVIVNLAVARENYPFNPGPNSKTKFPADYQVDYVRVWKLEQSAAKKMSEFPQINLKDNGWISMEKEVLKKKIPLIYPKKALHKEQGFVSLIPVSNDNYLVQLNGNGEVHVSAWIKGIEQTQFISEVAKLQGENILGKDISIQLKDAPKNIELKITYGGQTISYFPFN